MNKIEFHNSLINQIEARISSLRIILNEAYEAASGNDTKSSAGDKHETGVAMAQLEQEKITKQINELLILQANALKINPSNSAFKISLGSLVKTSNGWYYFSVGIGSFEVNGNSVFALNPKAPIGKLMLGKTENSFIEFNGKQTKILRVI